MDFDDRIILGAEFEQIVCDIFVESGYGVKQSCYQSVPFDLEATKDEKTYYVEVKISYHKNRIPRIVYESAISKLIDYSKNAGGIPVFVVGGILEEEDRFFLERNQSVEVIDIANLLYAVTESEEIKNRLVSFLPLSVSEIIPQKCFFKVETLQHGTFSDELVEGCRDALGGYHGLILMKRLFNGMLDSTYLD